MDSLQLLEKRSTAHHDADSPWMRELGLIESIGTGFVDRAEQAVSDLPHIALTGLELAGSAAAGAGLRIMAEAGGPWATAAAVDGYGLLGVMSVDVAWRLGSSGAAAVDAWRSPKNYMHDKQVVASNIGTALFDYPLMAAGGAAGYWAPELGARFGYTGLQSSYASWSNSLYNSTLTSKLQALGDRMSAIEGKLFGTGNASELAKVEVPLLSAEDTAKLYGDLAAQDGEYTFVKKPYTVTIRDGVPGETVTDIQGQPQFVEVGKMVVQRVMPDGRLDTYPIDQETFHARWQPTGNTPNEYTPVPKPTQMVLLPEDVQITGHAGPQLGSAQDMLATDGTKFWTVQKQPLLDTYDGVDARSQALVRSIADPGSAGGSPAPRTPSETSAAPTGDHATAPTSGEQSLAALRQRSIESSQAHFQFAVENDSIIEAEKLPIQITVRRVDNPAGELLPTNENGSGQMVKQGKWVLTRLNSDGTPFVLEKTGLPDQWPASLESLTRAYDVPESVIHSGSGTVWSRPGFVGRFVKLDAPLDVILKNGDVLHGQPGDFLFNHDFEAAAKTPGTSFAIVSPTSFDASYKPADVRSLQLLGPGH